MILPAIILFSSLILCSTSFRALSKSQIVLWKAAIDLDSSSLASASWLSRSSLIVFNSFNWAAACGPELSAVQQVFSFSLQQFPWFPSSKGNKLQLEITLIGMYCTNCRVRYIYSRWVPVLNNCTYISPTVPRATVQGSIFYIKKDILPLF